VVAQVAADQATQCGSEDPTRRTRRSCPRASGHQPTRRSSAAAKRHVARAHQLGRPGSFPRRRRGRGRDCGGSGSPSRPPVRAATEPASTGPGPTRCWRRSPWGDPHGISPGRSPRERRCRGTGGTPRPRRVCGRRPVSGSRCGRRRPCRARCLGVDSDAQVQGERDGIADPGRDRGVLVEDQLGVEDVVADLGDPHLF
jgi:hypothetical protein